MIKNNKGVTLVELLAALTILSLVGVLVWSIFFQGYKFTKQSITKSQLQQEANLVVTTLDEIHHHANGLYSVNSNQCAIIIKTNEETILQDSRMCIEAKTMTDPQTDFSENIDPNQKDPSLIITVSDKKNRSNSVSIDVYLNRLKSGVSN